MENMNEVEQSEIREDDATEHRSFTVGCNYCNATTDEFDYPSSAAQEAKRIGMKIVWLGESEGIAFCKECIEKEVYKSWVI